MNKHFTAKSFTFFTINFIVGLGFISTITTVLKLGYWGYLVIALSLLTVLGTSLVFSRLSNKYSDHYGGSYAFARNIDDDIANNTYSMEYNSKQNTSTRMKKSFLRNFIFFIGWNQFIQSPILSSISPLLLSSVIEGILGENVPNKLAILWIIRTLSVVIFALLIIISTLGLKLSTKVIFATSIVKWSILAIGIVLIMTQISLDGYSQSLEATKNISAKIIFSSTLLFIFAFAGIEDMAAMTKDVHFKNFRTILLTAIGAIFVFYMGVYTVMLGLEQSGAINNKFYHYYSLALGTFGLVLFIIGFISNDIGYKITQTVSTARKLVPLAEDNLIHEMFSEHNSKQEYKKAIIFVAIFTLISMISLSLYVLLAQKPGEENYFDAVINMSCVALLVEDIFTFIVAFVLQKKKKIEKIPFWEQVIYFLSILWAGFLVLTFFVPNILGESISASEIFTIIGYFVFILIGFGIRYYSYRHKKYLLKKQIKIS